MKNEAQQLMFDDMMGLWPTPTQKRKARLNRKPITVELTQLEMDEIAWRKSVIDATSKAKGLVPAHGHSLEEDALFGDRSTTWTGLCGECAVGKLLGLYWEFRVLNYVGGEDEADGADFVTQSGHELQVRCRRDTTKELKVSDLIIRPEDKDRWLMILCTQQEPKLPHIINVWGWIRASDREVGWWGDRGKRNDPAHWVEKGDLHTMLSLWEMIYEQR